MSLTRTFNWTCDHPDCVDFEPVRREESGIPFGFISTVAIVGHPKYGIVKHFCGEHRNEVPREFWHPSSRERYPAPPAQA